MRLDEISLCALSSPKLFRRAGDGIRESASGSAFVRASSFAESIAYRDGTGSLDLERELAVSLRLGSGLGSGLAGTTSTVILEPCSASLVGGIECSVGVRGLALTGDVGPDDGGDRKGRSEANESLGLCARARPGEFSADDDNRALTSTAPRSLSITSNIFISESIFTER
jgi:hypothetical protein